MVSIESIKRLCAPSFLYLVVSTTLLIIAMFRHHASGVLFRSAIMTNLVINLVCSMFYTWVLNLICGAGYTWLSWTLVLAPFVVLGLGMVTNVVRHPSSSSSSNNI